MYPYKQPLSGPTIWRLRRPKPLLRQMGWLGPTPTVGPAAFNSARIEPFRGPGPAQVKLLEF